MLVHLERRHRESVMRMLPLLLLADAACSSPSEPPPPPPPFTVAFSNVTRRAGLDPDTQRHECLFDLTATAAGGHEGDSARWLISEDEFRFNDGTRFEFTLFSTDMLDYWGSDRIATGETQVATRIADAAEPFDLAFTFRYEDPDFRDFSEFVFVDCQ